MKYILVSLLLFSFYKIEAQNDTISPWEFRFIMGCSIPIDIKNDNAANVDAGVNTEISVNYHISNQYLVSIKYNYTQHAFSDLYSLNAYPIIRSHYFLPMFGKVQEFEKFSCEENIGFGMLYARIPAYLSQKIGEYYFGKLGDESRNFICEFDFTGSYQFTKHFNILLNTALKFSKIKWNINYNGFVESDIGLHYISSDSYVQNVYYFPFAISLGVAYKL